MSIKDLKILCQPAVTNVGTVLAPYLQVISHILSLPPYIFKTNLTSSQLSLLLAIWTEANLPKFVIRTNPIRSLQAFTDEMQAWDHFFDVNHNWYLISGDLSEQEETGDITTELSTNMHRMLFSNSPLNHYVVPSSVIHSEIPDPTAYKKLCLSLHTKEKIPMKELIQTLVTRGYTRHTSTIDNGSIIIRGEQIDISHPLFPGHFTLTFFGNVLESIVHHQGRRSKVVDQITIPPIKFPSEKSSWQKVFQNGILFHPTEHHEFTGQKTVTYNSFQETEQFPFSEIDREKDGLETSIYYGIYTNQDRVQNYFADRTDDKFLICPSPLAEFPIGLTNHEMSLVTERFLFPINYSKDVSPVSYERAQELIGQLKEGLPAVHADHGIGMYEGLQLKKIDKIEREYLVLRYAEGDALSVPVEFAHKITAYNGETTPRINRLGGSAWKKAKKKATYDAALFAKELLDIAAERASNVRNIYRIDNQLDDKLEQDFPYELTADQTKTWQEVLKDLESPHPMDRLIVGDVGFGKTEIAIRAAAHVVNNKKQVAILAPTTLLVQQHFDTIKQRLPHLNNKIGLLSRISLPAEQVSTRQQIENGELSIVVGTHALLSKSTKWANLSLVIIDEEQRFGVTQKEHFKKLRSTIDTLSLSATPIPRTLSMALSGLRQLSIISTPPKGRKDINTIVKRDNDRILATALAKELNRQGQVYLVAPTIRQLPSLQERVKSLAPNARTAIAHGQLSAKELSSIMSRFDKGDIDVLVSSSIVENGLDLPNANTLIVCRATNFGLSELYQLRGRVGRRDRQGYAYFLYDRDNLTGVQKQRLAALTESARLGSGWSLAQRDLEIRGAGNLLGAEQSGSVNAVGVQLYLDMVQKAMTDKDDSKAVNHDVEITLPLPAIIPTHFISDNRERTRWYQKLTRTDSVKHLNQQMNHLKESYGQYPPETANLALILTLQRVAGKIGITHITSSKVTPPDEDPYDRLEVTAKNLPQAIKVLGELGNWIVRADNKLTWDVDAITPDLIEKIIKVISLSD